MNSSKKEKKNNWERNASGCSEPLISGSTGDLSDTVISFRKHTNLLPAFQPFSSTETLEKLLQMYKTMFGLQHRRLTLCRRP